MTSSQHMDIDGLTSLLDNEAFSASDLTLEVPQYMTSSAPSQQLKFAQEVADDFEGFGSITEMVKNKDKLIEKAL